MKTWILVLIASGLLTRLVASHAQPDSSPQFLYKVLSVDNWQRSQTQNNLVLSKDDNEFIHLSTKDQLDRITSKYWADVPEFVILKVATNRLTGRLVLEANPGGSSKYYHLYDGSIPLQSVVESKIVKQ